MDRAYANPHLHYQLYLLMQMPRQYELGWLPVRSQAALGLRLAALLVGCMLLENAVQWTAMFGHVVWRGIDRESATVGLIHGLLSGLWTMTGGADYDRGLWLTSLVLTIFCAACGWVVVSRRGVAWRALRRFPRG